MRARVELYPDATRRIEALPGKIPMLRRVAGAIAEESKRLAGSQRIRDGIGVDAGHDDGPVARVNADHWTSWFVEAGTLHQPARAYLRRAMESGAARQVL